MTTIKEILANFTDTVKNDVGAIYTAITGEVNNDAELNFDSPSKTAEWKLWAQVYAFFSHLMKALSNEAKADIEEIRAKGVASNRAFFYNEWKKFQYGDTLLIDDITGKYYYAVVDEAKQIIKRLSIVKNLGNWEIRCAKEDGTGNPIPLVAAELTAFKAFINLTAPPGPIMPVLSRNSDKLSGKFTIYYNALSTLADVKASVEAAYLEYLAKIDIDGLSIYHITKHIDQMQKAAGVVDVQDTDVQAKIDGDAYDAVARTYTPSSGYLEKDDTLTFDDILTYVAE